VTDIWFRLSFNDGNVIEGTLSDVLYEKHIRPLEVWAKCRTKTTEDPLPSASDIPVYSFNE